jgi:hypothetical protein
MRTFTPIGWLGSTATETREILDSFLLRVMKRRRAATLRYPPCFGIRLGRLCSQLLELF